MEFVKKLTNNNNVSACFQSFAQCRKLKATLNTVPLISPI